MFDTVNFWIAGNTYVESKIVEKLHETSKEVKEIYSHKDDSLFYSGMLNNYKVQIYPSGISLRGSIAKYLFGNDTIEFANRLSYKRGIEEIFDLLGLDLNSATISRVDVGQNLKLNNDVSTYYPLLSAASRLRRSEYLNSLYFRNGRKELIFYNKVVERTERGFDKFSGNILRYELKLKKNPSTFLRTGKLYAKSLYRRPIYNQLLDLWYNQYNKIQKTSYCKPLLHFSNAKDLKNNLAAIALAEIELDVFRQLETNYKNGSINSINAYRCRKLIDELQSTKRTEIESNYLLEELNSSMEFTYKQALKAI